VDRDTRAALGNVRNLGLEGRVELVRSAAGPFLSAAGAAGAAFDLIFVDPPYRLADRLGPELETHLPAVLAPGGRVIVESAARRPAQLNRLEPLRERRYGGTHVGIYAAGGGP
jgi:16S rRNA G966 N2-methylase RsmD